MRTFYKILLGKKAGKMLIFIANDKKKMRGDNTIAQRSTCSQSDDLMAVFLYGYL